MIRKAEISDDGLYRYALLRRWGAGPSVCWVMLNPSTADGETDDRPSDAASTSPNAGVTAPSSS